jgi:hypothetical protein
MLVNWNYILSMRSLIPALIRIWRPWRIQKSNETVQTKTIILQQHEQLVQKPIFRCFWFLFISFRCFTVSLKPTSVLVSVFVRTSVFSFGVGNQPSSSILATTTVISGSANMLLLVLQKKVPHYVPTLTAWRCSLTTSHVTNNYVYHYMFVAM